MRLYFCAIVTLVEMLDTSFVNAVIGKIMDVFAVSYDHISNLYISIAIGASISLPLTKYCYSVFNLKRLYLVLIIILLINFTWAFFTGSWVIFCILRATQGFCLTLLYSLSFMDLIVQSQNKDRDLNLINSISILGVICGPALGGYITLISWNYIFMIFNLILGGLLWFIWKVEFKNNHSFVKVSLLDVVEYICFVLLISIGSLIIDGLLPMWFLWFVAILSLGIAFKYKRFVINFIFDKRIFNNVLWNVIIIHILTRFSVIAFIPLLASILYRDYKYSTIEISFLLILMGLGSLLGKVLSLRGILNRQRVSEVYFIYMGLLSIFALSPFHSPHLVMFILFLLGVFSSLIYNYINSCIFYKQPDELGSDLSVMLTIIQMLLYGLCTTLVFKLFSYLEVKHTSETSLAIIILFMIYTLSLASFFYKRIFAKTSWDI